MTTKFKKSFSPMLICWNDIKIHLGFEDSYLVPPPYLNVQWSSQSNAAMLSVKSAMMRWHKSVPLSIPRSAGLRWRKSALSPLDTSAPRRPLSTTRLSIWLMIFPNQTEFGLEFSGHWQWSSKFSKPIWIWFGICVLQNQFFSFQTKLELVWKIVCNFWV